ncbi:MAG: TatD family hydrolase [Parcubacteria group bacterium]|nr:TatD family hydrolase [Parcubacteria group bacterium]
MTLFDSHCHLHFRQFDNDREEIIKKLRDFNIKIINVGTDFKESEKAVALAKQYPDLMWASVGLHPNDNLEENFDINKYRELAKLQNVVAIGECGLDYFRSPSETEIKRQKEIFVKQIGLAKELKKPLILHCRPPKGSQDAYEDAIEILKYENFNISTGNGVAHFFSDLKETAKKFLELGFYISFAGPITFAPEYKEIVEFVPMNRILIETDAPFAAPAPHRGRRNEPAYVEFVAHKIAEWKRLSIEEVAEQTTKNTLRLFQIK